MRDHSDGSKIAVVHVVVEQYEHGGKLKFGKVTASAKNRSGTTSRRG